ncbi:hypothetical protein MNBD_UNCLBAC01-1211 [hydrothermal vent metagenome]|uniref:ParE-like toxin domain-containing protein n=1 Tax=hydrothermal vent metagenome TaxID=652676 RepID=A0A3B1DG18_9ZZZZ
MISYLDDDFIKYFSKLPLRIKKKARKNYKLWKQDHSHPSLDFKQAHPSDPIYSVRVGIGWRALGLKHSSNLIIWFWIGSHESYNKLLTKF